ncbi:hypothetical protein MTO96_001995 [Rhipicephalus appendiculatus]
MNDAKKQKTLRKRRVVECDHRNKDTLEWFSGQKVKCIEGEQIKQPAPCTSRKKWTFIPDVRDLSPTETVDLTKAEGFLSMYRAHCCSLLDAILIADFKAVQDMVLHFWSSLQEGFLSLLHSAIVCDIVSVWDDYLYAAMQEILTPREIQELPQSFQQELSLFTSQLPDWLRSVIPASLLLETKIRVLQEWTKVFKRQMSFTKLAQSCRSVLSNACYTQNMLDDLSKLVMDETVEEAFACLQNGRTASAMGVAELLSLLKKHASVEDLTEWMDMALDNAATEAGHSGTTHSRSVVYKDFMLSWMLLFSAIMRHLTLSRAQSFGHVHMLRVMIEEYMLLAFETSVGKEARNQRREKLLTCAKDPDTAATAGSAKYICVRIRSLESQQRHINVDGRCERQREMKQKVEKDRRAAKVVGPQQRGCDGSSRHSCPHTRGRLAAAALDGLRTTPGGVNAYPVSHRMESAS